MKPPGIPREPALPPALDFERLRKEGISRIESLGSSRWTDYNAHDPGITLLEALCFAINDLAYRCAFPMKDLLAPPPGQPLPRGDEGPLFSARSVLTCHPVTPVDYRKLLVDVDGVRDAWLSPSPAPCLPFYPDMEEGLGFQQPAASPGVEAVPLRGVYSVVLDLADDPLLGSLNDTTRPWCPGPGPAGEPLPPLEIVFPPWDHWRRSRSAQGEEAPPSRRLRWDDPWLKDVDATALIVTRANVDGDTLQVSVRVEVPGDDGRKESNEVHLSVRFQEPGESFTGQRQESIVRELGRTGRENPIEAYRRRLRKAFSVAAQAIRRLQQHRALCEDFHEPVAARFEEISLCADVDVAPDADLEEIQAQILVAVARLLAPPVRFYTLAELLSRGLPVERIFEGPALEHGFVLDEELAGSGPPRQVNGSDVLGAIMDVEGVIAVRWLTLSAHGADGRVLATGERWRIDLLDGHLPRLAPDRCTLVLFKQDIPYAIDAEEAKQKLEFLTAKEGMLELTRPTGLQLDLEPPAGSWKSLDDYRLLQGDLPRVYGVGSEQLPPSASPRRQAQARQLQAYLLLFDQLLSDSLAQLAHLRDLFSLDPAQRQTFFGGSLFQRPELRDLFQESFIRRVDAGEASPRQLAEDDETFLERRNQRLDHLLARFNERFTEYAAAMVLPDRAKARERRHLIDDKIAFLKDYPRLSSGRGTGFDAGAGERLWGCDNVSGLELRLSNLLGLRRRGRHHLAHRFELRAPDGAVAGHHFLRRDARGDVALRSPAHGTAEEAAAEMNALDTYAARRECYRIREGAGGEHSFDLVKSSGRLIAHGVGAFKTLEDAEDAIARLVDDTREQEGLHLVEHVLLRPILGERELFDVTRGPECEPCPESVDPYSFRATLLLPGWSPRFASPSFRAFVEHTARLEAPAHVLLKICWVGVDQMQQFESAFLPWLEERARPEPDPGVLAGRQDALMQALRSLRSIYPAATLHDFQEDRGENPVLLGRTQLGSMPGRPDPESE